MAQAPQEADKIEMGVIREHRERKPFIESEPQEKEDAVDDGDIVQVSGSLSAAEVEALLAKELSPCIARRMVSRMDVDADGRITKQEVVKYVARTHKCFLCAIVCATVIIAIALLAVGVLNLRLASKAPMQMVEASRDAQTVKTIGTSSTGAVLASKQGDMIRTSGPGLIWRNFQPYREFNGEILIDFGYTSTPNDRRRMAQGEGEAQYAVFGSVHGHVSSGEKLNLHVALPVAHVRPRRRLVPDLLNFSRVDLAELASQLLYSTATRTLQGVGIRILLGNVSESVMDDACALHGENNAQMNVQLAGGQSSGTLHFGDMSACDGGNQHNESRGARRMQTISGGNNVGVFGGGSNSGTITNNNYGPGTTVIQCGNPCCGNVQIVTPPPPPCACYGCGGCAPRRPTQPPPVALPCNCFGCPCRRRLVVEEGHSAVFKIVPGEYLVRAVREMKDYGMYPLTLHDFDRLGMSFMTQLGTVAMNGTSHVCASANLTGSLATEYTSAGACMFGSVIVGVASWLNRGNPISLW